MIFVTSRTTPATPSTGIALDATKAGFFLSNSMSDPKSGSLRIASAVSTFTYTILSDRTNNEKHSMENR